MKKLILISLLFITTSIIAQDVNTHKSESLRETTDEYKNYKPCVGCSIDNWENSTTGRVSNNDIKQPIQKSGQELKRGAGKVGKSIITTILSITALFILTKSNNEINRIIQ